MMCCYLISLGRVNFPMHMCDFSMIAMIVYFLKQNAPKILFHCAYFWGICAGNHGPGNAGSNLWLSSWGVLTIFLGSQLNLLAVFYVLMVNKERPILSDIPKVIGVTLVLLIFVYIANLLIGPPANYWYLAASTC